MDCISTSTVQHGQRAKANADLWPCSCPFSSQPAVQATASTALPEHSLLHKVSRVPRPASLSCLPQCSVLQPALPRKGQTSWAVSEIHADHVYRATCFPRTRVRLPRLRSRSGLHLSINSPLVPQRCLPTSGFALHHTLTPP